MALQQRCLGGGGFAAPSLRGAAPPIRSLRSRRLFSPSPAANSEAVLISLSFRDLSFNSAELLRGVLYDFVDIDGGRTVGFSGFNRSPEMWRLTNIAHVKSVCDSQIWELFEGPRDADHARWYLECSSLRYLLRHNNGKPFLFCTSAVMLGKLLPRAFVWADLSTLNSFVSHFGDENWNSWKDTVLTEYLSSASLDMEAVTHFQSISDSFAYAKESRNFPTRRENFRASRRRLVELLLWSRTWQVQVISLVSFSLADLAWWRPRVQSQLRQPHALKDLGVESLH
jgi:hypothetical protein